MRWLAPLFALSTLASWRCTPPPVPSGTCARDTDCQGRRICHQGRCRSPRAICRCGESARPTSPRPSDPPVARLQPIPRPGRPPGPAPLAIRAPLPVTPAAMFRLDSLRRGRSAYAGPARRPQRAWRRRLGGRIYASPAVGVDGTVYVSSQSRRIAAYTARGRLRWRFRAGDRVWSSPALSRDGATLYVGADDDHLYALAARSGRLRWKTKLGDCRAGARKNPEAVRCDVDSSPAVGPDGTIYVGGDGIFALSPRGKVRWHYATDERVRSSPALLPDGTVVAGSQDDRVHAVDARGQRQWIHQTGGDVDSSPAVGPDGTLYIGSDDGRLLALHHDGTYRWSILTRGPVRGSPAIGADGTVYVGSHDGRLYAVSPSGRVRWMVPTGRRIQASPVVGAAGRVYVASQDRFLYAVAGDGTVRWRWRFPAEVDSSVAITPQGRLYVGCDDGYLYQLK